MAGTVAVLTSNDERGRRTLEVLRVLRGVAPHAVAVKMHRDWSRRQAGRTLRSGRARMARLGGPTARRCRSLPSWSAGLAKPGWRSWTVTATFKGCCGPPDNREMAPLRQRVNFAGVSGARCAEAQTEAR